MNPLQNLDGYVNMLLVGTVRTGKSALLTELMLSALENPPALPASPLPRPALDKDVQAWRFTPRKDAL